METREIWPGTYFPTLPKNAGNLTAAQEPHGSIKAVPDAGHTVPNIEGNNSLLLHHDHALIRGTTYLDAVKSHRIVGRFPVEPRTSDPNLPQAVDGPSLLDIIVLNATEPKISKKTRRSNGTETDRCPSCRLMKIKCKQLALPDDPRCLHCLSLKLPITLCVRQAIYEMRPFEKWKNGVYENLFTAAPRVGKIDRTAQFGHYVNGPCLEIQCRDFEPTHDHQTVALKKDSSGWHLLTTTAFCLTKCEIDIGSYIDDCIPFVLAEVCESQSLASVFFRIVRVYQDAPLIKECLRLFTCIHLFFIGWQLRGPETLDMDTVHDSQSPWKGTTPVPRMIQNQLGHLIELQMSALDERILMALHTVTKKRNRSTWVSTILAFFILLHVRELDAGRNIYWSLYEDKGGFWIHPSKPNSLIEEELASCGALLAHFHSVVGNVPMTTNWDTERSRELLDHNEMAITTMKVLQSYVASLRERGVIGRKASEVYKPDDPKSVELTISTLVFENKETGSEVRGFL